MDVPTLLSAVAGFVFVTGSVEDFWNERRRSPVGAEALVGKTARVLPPEREGEAPGWVLVEGERWRATAPSALRPGDTVRIEEVRGLELSVAETDARPIASSAPIAAPRWQWLPGLALWGVAVVAALLSGGSLEAELAAGPLVVLLCYGVIAALAVDAG